MTDEQKRAPHIRDATEQDLPGILEIYNDAVLNTAAIWNDRAVDLSNREQWFKDRMAKKYPVLVAVQDSHVLAYASFADFRPFDGYRFTVEHSVYVHPAHRRKGLARALMIPLIQRARDLGKHIMVAAIEAENTPSIDLHKSLGFQQTGYMPQVGFKFGRWLDLLWMQLTLSDPLSYVPMAEG